MIAAVIERCAGIDVGRKFLAVCVMTGPANGEARSEIRQFGTTVPDVLQLRDWIEAEACTDVMMESTGSYWKPVFNILEGHTRVALANPNEVKAQGPQDGQQGRPSDITSAASANWESPYGLLLHPTQNPMRDAGPSRQAADSAGPEWYFRKNSTGRRSWFFPLPARAGAETGVSGAG